MKKSLQLESAIQAKLIRHYRSNGWTVVKLIRTNLSGMPDLMLLMRGEVRFVEVKRPGQQPTKLQRLRHAQLRSEGFLVDVMDSAEI